MSNFNSMLIDIVKNKNHCFVMGNNKIANNDVFEYMVNLTNNNEYEVFDLFEKENITTTVIKDLTNKTKEDKRKKIIASIKIEDFNDFLNIVKENSYETFENQSFYVINIHETSQNEDIYIRIYKLENKKLKQLDLKG